MKYDSNIIKNSIQNQVLNWKFGIYFGLFLTFIGKISEFFRLDTGHVAKFPNLTHF